jgi:signal transduction histidine kinase/HD-like signal output (HDOD) protein
MIATEPSKPRRIELILRQIESLPTLPVVATRLLSLTASDDSTAREVIQLISSDPALTAKVLSLCRGADKGLRAEVVTVDRAVMLLGFHAVRNAVLSVKVFEMFEAGQPARGVKSASRFSGIESPEREGDDASAQAFDRVGFWSHSLAVAILADLIAQGHRGDKDLRGDEAFVCGLLHDIGKLALDWVLPKSYARVVELTNFNHGNIAEFERRIVGIDHHTAGKRLAEQWQLPHRLQDCIWLHGSVYDTLPRLEHRRLIGLISLADLLARQHHVGYSGNFLGSPELRSLMEKLDLRESAVHHAVERLHDELEARGKALGLHDVPSHKLLLESIQRANEALGRVNQVLDRRGRTSAAQGRVLEAISAFHAMNTPGRSVQDVCDGVVESARGVFGAGFYAMLYAPDTPEHNRSVWLISHYNADGRPVQSQYIEAPPHAADLAQLDVSQPVGMSLMGLLPWIADYLVNAEDLRQVKLLPLSCGWGTSALLVHDREQLPAWTQLGPLAATWGSAIAAASQHDGARRLGEELAEANSALAEAQDHLLRQESMARLGEMAAGAAHEMNNPLAVISGRSQLLSLTLRAGSKEHKAAQTIFKEAHRLSDLITCLHMFAEPPKPDRRKTDLGKVLDGVIRKVHAGAERVDDSVSVTLQVKEPMGLLNVDGAMIERAVRELVLNSLQARPKQLVQVVAQLQPGGRAVVIRVSDDGEGMDEHTLAHAFDPFFSAKSAGRRVGMGLARAQQLIAAHGGDLELRSTRAVGTVATITLPLDPAD